MVLGLALFMVLPRFLENKRIEYLALPIYIALGVCLSPIKNGTLTEGLAPIALCGFILLLFSVGLEVKLPSGKEWWPAFGKALVFYLLTFALAFALAITSELKLMESFICAAALSGVSVGLIFPRVDPEAKGRFGSKFIHIFIAIEIITIAVFALAGPLLSKGATPYLGLKIIGIVLVIFVLSRLARKLGHRLDDWLEKTTHYRHHLLLFIVFAIAAIGERLGLSTPKTAFFLGLFMSYTRPFGSLTHSVLSTIGERFLIPIFFLSLGLQFNWNSLSWQIALPAVLAGLALWWLRYGLFKRLLNGTHTMSTLAGVNLTMVAIAVELLGHHAESQAAIAWVLVAGTVSSLLGLLGAGGEGQVNAQKAETAQ